MLNENDKVRQYMKKTIDNDSINALEFMVDYTIINYTIINKLNTCINDWNINDFYIGENIPDKKLKNAAMAYGRDVNKCPYNVCGLYDDTVFGSAKDGFTITTIGIMAHEMYAKTKIFVPWNSINNVIASKDSIIILCNKNIKIIITCREKPILQLMEKHLIEIKNEIINDYEKLIGNHNELKIKIAKEKKQREKIFEGTHHYNSKGICIKCGCSESGYNANRRCEGNPFDN